MKYLSNEYPIYALIIGNAGIKSLAALPFLELLMEHKMLPDVTIASGAGATVASLVYMGISPKEIPKMMAELYDRNLICNKLNYSGLLKLSPIKEHMPMSPDDSFVNPAKLIKVYQSLFKGFRLERIFPELRVQVTDLETTAGKLLKEGPLDEILYATNAMFPVMPAADIDDHLYVDGVFSSSLPLLPTIQEDHPKLIAAIDFDQNTEIVSQGFFEFWANLFNRTYTVVQSDQASLAVSLVEDVEFHFHLVKFERDISIWDPSQIDHILKVGEKEAQRFVSELDAHLQVS